MGKRGTALVVAIVMLASLMGCGHSKSKSWRDTNACSLLTSKEVAGYLGKPTTVKGGKEFGRPSCYWSVHHNGGVGLTLLEPSFKPDRLPVGKTKIVAPNGMPAWAFNGLGSSCRIIIDSKPAMVSLDVDTDLTESKGPVKATCDNVTKTAVAVVKRLGWKA